MNDMNNNESQGAGIKRAGKRTGVTAPKESLGKPPSADELGRAIAGHTGQDSLSELLRKQPPAPTLNEEIAMQKTQVSIAIYPNELSWLRHFANLEGKRINSFGREMLIRGLRQYVEERKN